MNIEEKVYLSVGETQAVLGSSRAFVYKLVSEGKLSQYHVNKRTYFNRKEVYNLFQKAD